MDRDILKEGILEGPTPELMFFGAVKGLFFGIENEWNRKYAVERIQVLIAAMDERHEADRKKAGL